MAEFAQQRGKRRDDSGLGGVLDLLLANARLVLGVSGAAVLAIATLAVKRVRLGGSPSAARGDVLHHVSERCLVVFTVKSVGSLCASLSLSNRCCSPVEELWVTATPRVRCALLWAGKCCRENNSSVLVFPVVPRSLCSSSNSSLL